MEIRLPYISSIYVNPLTRLLAGISVTVFLLLSLNPYRSAICAILLLVLSGLDKQCLYFLLSVTLVSGLTFISALLYAKPTGLTYAKFSVFDATIVQITDGSLYLSTSLFARMIAFGVISLLVFYRINFTALADGFVQLLRVPRKLVFSTLSGLRTCLLIGRDCRNIRYMCALRGVSFFSRGVMPLFVSAMRRGYWLSIVLKLRGIEALAKTHARSAHLGVNDLMFFCACIAIMVVSHSVSVG